jgi:hypothetical protein
MYDLNTVGGMNRAVEYTRALLELLNEGGVWVVPRSGTMVQVFKSERRVIITDGPVPDAAIAAVIKNMGWAVTKGESK